MKTLALLSILFFSLAAGWVKNDYISIEYAGNADKAMHVVYVSKKPIPISEQVVTLSYSDLPYNYIVSDQEFSFINKVISSSLKKKLEKKDYNGFRITIRENGSLVYYFITRKNSNSFFLKTNAYLKGNKRNKELISRLTSLRTSNVFPDSPHY